MVRQWQTSFSAKKAEAPRNSGGSPTALEECARGVRMHGASRSRVTRRSNGMSLALGILYVPAQPGLPSQALTVDEGL